MMKAIEIIQGSLKENSSIVGNLLIKLEGSQIEGEIRKMD